MGSEGVCSDSRCALLMLTLEMDSVTSFLDITTVATVAIAD